MGKWAYQERIYQESLKTYFVSRHYPFSFVTIRFFRIFVSQNWNFLYFRPDIVNRNFIYAAALKLGGSLPHIIFVILKHVTNDMQKIFLIQTTEKKYAFWCHTVTSGINLRRLPHKLSVCTGKISKIVLLIF